LPGILERYEYKGSKHYTLLGVKEKIFSGPFRPAALVAWLKLQGA